MFVLNTILAISNSSCREVASLRRDWKDFSRLRYSLRRELLFSSDSYCRIREFNSFRRLSLCTVRSCSSLCFARRSLYALSLVGSSSLIFFWISRYCPSICSSIYKNESCGVVVQYCFLWPWFFPIGEPVEFRLRVAFAAWKFDQALARSDDFFQPYESPFAEHLLDL